MERLVDQARLTTAAQFYDRNEKAGLIEINPAGGNELKRSKTARSGTRPKPENISPWSKESVERHAEKIRETLTLLQQGRDDAEIFVGNNTRERNGKELISTMLQEHLQKLNKISLKRTPSQATGLLDSGSQNSETKEQQEETEGGQTMNHTEEIRGKRYQAMPEVNVRAV